MSFYGTRALTSCLSLCPHIWLCTPQLSSGQRKQENCGITLASPLCKPLKWPMLLHTHKPSLCLRCPVLNPFLSTEPSGGSANQCCTVKLTLGACGLLWQYTHWLWHFWSFTCQDLCVIELSYHFSGLLFISSENSWCSAKQIFHTHDPSSLGMTCYIRDCRGVYLYGRTLGFKDMGTWECQEHMNILF